MRASKYTLVLADHDRIHAVSLLTRAAIELSPDAYEYYLSLISDDPPSPRDETELDFARYLREQLFIVEDDFDDVGWVAMRSQQERADNRQLGLVIAPTIACNLGCHYCFETKVGGELTADAQRKIADYAAANITGRSDLSVQWFGGEPLLALDAIKTLSRELMRIAASASAAYAATVITNGVLLSQETALTLSELGVVAAQVSLDGDRPLHDRVRGQQFGKGSFDTIMANIVTASPVMRVKARVHVAPYSVKSAHDLIETLYADGMAPHLGELYFAPLFNYKSGMTTKPYEADGKRYMSAREFAAVQISLLDHASQRGFTISDPLEVSYGICTAVRRNTIVFDSKGLISKCYKDVGVDAEALGTLDSGITDSEKLSSWLEVPLPRDTECRDCRFLPICLGGCSKQWKEGASKDVICTPMRFNWEDRLRLYFRE